MSKNYNDNIIKFILSQKFITLTVIGSIFTFAFISSLKRDMIDPLLDFLLPEENFGFMDITIRDGMKINTPPKQIELRVGNFFKEFITWILAACTLYALSVFTNFPITPDGNSQGSAVL